MLHLFIKFWHLNLAPQQPHASLCFMCKEPECQKACKELFLSEKFNLNFVVLLDFACQVFGLLHASAQDFDLAPRWVKQRCESLCTKTRPLGVSLYLCHGALAMLSWKGGPTGPRWEQLLLLVPNVLLDLDIT